jgi:hypothetical protein
VKALLRAEFGGRLERQMDIYPPPPLPTSLASSPVSSNLVTHVCMYVSRSPARPARSYQPPHSSSNAHSLPLRTAVCVHVQHRSRMPQPAVAHGKDALFHLT